MPVSIQYTLSYKKYVCNGFQPVYIFHATYSVYAVQDNELQAEGGSGSASFIHTLVFLVFFCKQDTYRRTKEEQRALCGARNFCTSNIEILWRIGSLYPSIPTHSPQPPQSSTSGSPLERPRLSSMEPEPQITTRSIPPTQRAMSSSHD